jgi:hypothetical protein
LELRFPRLFVDLLFLAAKVAADYADAADLGKRNSTSYSYSCSCS